MSTSCRYDDSSTKTAFDTFLEFADNSLSNQSQAAHSSLAAPVHLVLSESREPSGEPQDNSSSSQSQVAHSSLTAPVHLVLSESREPSGQPQDNSSSNQSQVAHSSLTAPVHLVLSESGEPSGEPQEEATNLQGHEDVHARLRKELSEVFCRAH